MARAKKAVRLPSRTALARLRALKWRHCPERRLSDEQDAAEFIRDVGLCLASPVRNLPLPSWVEAVHGRRNSRRLSRNQLGRDRRAPVLREALDRLIRQRVVFETNCLWRTAVLVSRELFPCVYAIAGDLDPEADYLEQHRRGELNEFAIAVYETVLRDGPVVRADLEGTLGLATEGELHALARVLNQLSRTIKIVRASQTPEHGPAWDAFYRWAPEVVREARGMTRLEVAMRVLAAFVNESIVVARVTAQALFSGFLTPEVCSRAIDLLVESGQLFEWRRKLTGAQFMTR